ncbi:phage tail tape measure protein [Deinococcus sp. D7000]|nr:phage tail tape measure protein [Deinococcus sp. D7000]
MTQGLSVGDIFLDARIDTSKVQEDIQKARQFIERTNGVRLNIDSRPALSEIEKVKADMAALRAMSERDAQARAQAARILGSAYKEQVTAVRLVTAAYEESLSVGKAVSTQVTLTARLAVQAEQEQLAAVRAVIAARKEAAGLAGRVGAGASSVGNIAGITQLQTAIGELSSLMGGLASRQKIVIQDVQKIDPVATAAARGVGILTSKFATTRLDLETFNRQGGVLRAVLTGIADSAAPLSRELSVAEAALKRLQTTSNTMNGASLAQRFKLERAAVSEVKQELNSYRIAWQTQGKTDAEASAFMARKQTAIQGTIAALEAERAALQSSGAMTAAETKRYQELTAQINNLSIALRTAASVQAQVNGSILKGSLAAGVRDGMGAQQQMSAALKSTTMETQRLIDAEKAGLLSKGQLATALTRQMTAQRGSLAAIEAEMAGLRQLGVLDVQQTERLATLTTAQAGYTRALMASVEAQRAAAASSSLLRAGMMGAGGMGTLNTAAMAASFVSPSLGMAAMAASMGPAIAGMIALGVATAGTARFLMDGADKAAVWGRNMQQLQALTHQSSEEINEFGSYVRDLSTELPINAKHLTELGRQAVLVGLHGSDGMRAYTESMAALGVVLRDVNGQTVSLEKTGQEVVKVLRSTGMTTKEVTDNFSVAIDTLVGLKTAFGVQVPEVTNLAKFWSSYAATVGFTTDQIWAWSAALVSVGARAQGAGGALTKMLEHAAASAATGGKDLQRWADVLGLTSEQTKDLLKTDPSTFLRKFAEGLKRTSDEGTDYSITLEGLHINTAQVVRTAAEMATALPSMDNALRVSAESARDHGLAMRSAKEAADNYKDAQTELANAWENFKTKAGTGGVTVLTTIVEKLTAAVKWTDDLFAAWNDPKELRAILKIQWGEDSGTMMALKLIGGGLKNADELAGTTFGKTMSLLLFGNAGKMAEAENLQTHLIQNGLIAQPKTGAERQDQLLKIMDDFEKYSKIWADAIKKGSEGAQ